MPAIFYVIVTAARLNVGNLRSDGWIFDMGEGGHEPWYAFYSYFGPFSPFLNYETNIQSCDVADYNLIRFAPLWSTLPTQFAL